MGSFSEKESYMLIPCGISGIDNRLMSHVETATKVEIHVPADGKTKACIIRQLSDSKFLVKCRWCGDLFETYYCKIVDNRGRYCSRPCIGKANGAQRVIDKKGILTAERVTGKKNPNWQGGDFVDCMVCGNPFWLYPSRNQKTCSNRCGYERAKLVRKGVIPSLNHRGCYKGIDSWNKIRRRVLDRDNYTCQDCLVYLPQNTGFLHIHHIKRLLDGGTNTDKNLITLCRNCHTYRHRFDRIR